MHQTIYHGNTGGLDVGSVLSSVIPPWCNFTHAKIAPNMPKTRTTTSMTIKAISKELSPLSELDPPSDELWLSPELLVLLPPELLDDDALLALLPLELLLELELLLLLLPPELVPSPSVHSNSIVGNTIIASIDESDISDLSKLM